MTTDPMKRYFDDLRQELKELKDRRAILDCDIDKLEQLETFLVNEHSNPNIQFMVKRFVNPARDAHEKSIPLEEDQDTSLEEDQQPRLTPNVAVRRMFQPGKGLTSKEVRDQLEQLRQQGLIDTTSVGFDLDRTNKILRTLRDQGFLKRVEAEESGVHNSYTLNTEG